jgi:hypothetical protein
MKVALEGVSFGQVAWSRTVLGAIALGLIVLVTRPRVAAATDAGSVLPRGAIVWAHFLVVSATTCVIPSCASRWAEQYVSSSSPRSTTRPPRS